MAWGATDHNIIVLTSYKGKIMRMVVLMTVLMLGTSAGSLAQAPEGALGEWVLNVERSSFSPGQPPRWETSVWSRVPEGIKIVTEGIDANGKSMHSEIVTRFDGSWSERKGSGSTTARAFRQIDARTYEYVQRVNGKVTVTARGVVSADGNVRTQTTEGIDEAGTPVRTTVVWERRRP